VPVLQNRVYPTQREARAAPAGRIELLVCDRCGFGHNAAFDPRLVEYDEHYDNQVPSAVMDAHYRSLVSRLASRFALDGRLVLDVGCGKGTFLHTAASMLKHMRGIGIDPSYEGLATAADGRLQFVAEMFDSRHVTEEPALAVCRHVLEHLPQPVEFLASLRKALSQWPRTPLFLEVPDTSWITANAAFWDFCYEHCNYFDASSLRLTVAHAGFNGASIDGTFFGNQYLWVEHDPSAPNAQSRPEAGAALGLVHYAKQEARALQECSQRLGVLTQQGHRLVVWGMATKGVMFVNLLDATCQRFAACIDINKDKQGAYIPLTGHRIEPPVALQQLEGEQLGVVVMNTNYLDEIRGACTQLNVQARFLDANGLELA
jgi:SAM-dependent methyltransferase